MKKRELVLLKLFIQNMLVVPSTLYFNEKRSAHPVSSGSVVPGRLSEARTRHQCRGQQALCYQWAVWVRLLLGCLRQSPSHAEQVVQTSYIHPALVLQLHAV